MLHEQATELDLDVDAGSSTSRHRVPSSKLLPFCWLLQHANNATHLVVFAVGLVKREHLTVPGTTESPYMAAVIVLVLILPPTLAKSFYLSSASSNTAPLSSII